MTLNYSQILLAGALSLVLVAGMTSPAFASLVGDIVHIEAISGIPCIEDVVVEDPGVEIIDCGGISIDINGDSIWFESTTLVPNGAPIIPATFDFTDLNWVDNPSGIITGVELIPPETAPVDTMTLDFGDHSIFLEYPEFILDCGIEESCIVEWHINIQTDHDQPVAGEHLAVNSSALVIAGLTSMSVWMIPAVAGLAGAGIYLVKFRANRD